MFAYHRARRGSSPAVALFYKRVRPGSSSAPVTGEPLLGALGSAIMACPAHVRFEMLVLRVARCDRPARVPLHAGVPARTLGAPIAAARPEGSTQLGARHVRWAKIAAVFAIDANAILAAMDKAAARVQSVAQLICHLTAARPRVAAHKDSFRGTAVAAAATTSAERILTAIDTVQRPHRDGGQRICAAVTHDSIE